ncbi:MAG: FadR/GntR family transcriptional regulator [Nitrospinota bacterium]
MRKIKISDQVAQQIEQMIIDGTFEPGEKIPTERQLSERLQISRVSLREAIQKLVSKGLIEVYQGRGTFVSKSVDGGVANSLIDILKNQPNADFDAICVRKEMEAVAAHDAATNATYKDRDKIWKMYHNVVKVQKQNSLSIDKVRADSKFHLSVVEASHNVVLFQFTRSIIQVTEGVLTAYLDSYYSDSSFIDRIAKQHRAMVDAIMDLDPNAAKTATKYHLDFALKSFKKFKQQNQYDNSKKIYSSLF